MPADSMPLLVKVTRAQGAEGNPHFVCSECVKPFEQGDVLIVEWMTVDGNANNVAIFHSEDCTATM